MRLFGLLVVANLACVTTRAQTAAPLPQAISASDFLRAQWNAPTGSDDQFRRATAIIGLIARREGSALDFQTAERSYFVRCWLTAEVAASSSLEPGQLVTVRGVGNGLKKDAPELTNCTVMWLGDAPSSQPEDLARHAVVTGSSVNLCAVEEGLRSLPDPKLAPLPPFTVMVREKMERVRARSRADLEKAGAPALPCDHPLVTLVTRCQAATFLEHVREDTSECTATEVRKALAHMASELE